MRTSIFITIVGILFTQISDARMRCVQVLTIERHGKNLIKEVKNSEIDAIKLKLDDPDVDINYVDSDGSTALIHAVNFEKKKITHLLLQHPDIDVNIVNKLEKSALYYAIYWQHSIILNLLLDHPNIDVNSRVGDGYTPLLQAIEGGNIDALKRLLQHPKIDVNQTDYFDQTPLIKAILDRRIEVVKLLLKHSDIKLYYDKFGKTSLDYALETRNLKFVLLVIGRSKK